MIVSVKMFLIEEDHHKESVLAAEPVGSLISSRLSHLTVSSWLKRKCVCRGRSTTEEFFPQVRR